jgi:hypothetical protein
MKQNETKWVQADVEQLERDIEGKEAMLHKYMGVTREQVCDNPNRDILRIFYVYYVYYIPYNIYTIIV